MISQLDSAPLMMQIAAQAMEVSDNIVLVMQPGPATGLTLLGANDAFCRSVGIAPAEVAGRSFASFAWLEGAGQVLADVEHAAARGASLRAEMPCRRGDGGRFWLGLHVMPAADPTTGAARCVLLGRDITQRLLAREQAHAVQQLLAKVLISVDVPVAILAGDGRIVKTNPKLDRLLGTAGAMLEGGRFADLAGPGDQPDLATLWRMDGPSRTEHRGRYRLRHADGTPIWVNITATVADTGEQQRFRVLTLMEDQAPPELFQVAGKIRLVGLGEVKAALGDRWPSMRDRAVGGAEHVLRRKLGPKDSFSRTRDDGFLICFADLDEEAASFTAAMIGREIRMRLIGLGETPEETAVTAIAARIAAPSDSAAQGQAAHAILEQRLNARRGEIEAQARRVLADAVATATCTLSPVFGRDGRQIVAHYARLPLSLQRSLPVATAALPPAERGMFDIDALTVRLAAQLAMEQTLQNGPSHMFVDVGFEVFHTRASTDIFLEACRRLDPAVRQGLVMVLNSMPEGVTSSRMLDCVHRLRPFCRVIGFALREAEMPDFDLALASSPVLVIDCERVAPLLAQPQRFERLRLQFTSARARLLVRNVPGTQLGDRMLAMGADFVSAPPPDATTG